MVDLSKIAAFSQLAGLADEGPVIGVGSIPAQTVPWLSEFVQASVAVAMPRNDLLPVMLIHFGGLDAISDYWYPFTSGMAVALGRSDFYIYVISNNSASGRLVNLAIINETGSDQAFGGCSIDIVGRAYSYPWQ